MLVSFIAYQVVPEYENNCGNVKTLLEGQWMTENLDFVVLLGERARIAKHLYCTRHSAELSEVP